MRGVGTCSTGMSYTGKLELEGATKGRPPSRGDSRPGVSLIKSCIKNDSTLLKQADHYLNPDPLVRLIGKVNETQVKIENQNFTALIDSGAQNFAIDKIVSQSFRLKNENIKRNITSRWGRWNRRALSRVCRGSSVFPRD